MRNLLLASLLVAMAGTAHADVTRDALAGILKCAEVQDPARRLECFDAATPSGKAALAAPAPPAQSVQPAKEKSFLDWFGLSKPNPVTKADDFGKPAPEPGPGEVTQITDTVLEFAKTARGKAVFILENGQIWRQLDADGTDVQPAPRGTTMKVTVETGTLGSYNLTIEGRNGLVKVSRLK